ncbi:Macrolide export ATP-binding/permease protein macB [Fibrisoma limi BUZ 3]|uniref:Macrolide export ATP-binding/permease protein macB n=1 Tax=Fibrisoma limi BUZ 3 TaxID=1185876 RepID=I2GEX4_9BACT|nr:ABC transporter permease [Fibrisoma limi]CCH52449.1 Macrolide export ATP-binding/permease protein macB [Fibrisoma limi BUZ 3]
MRSAPTPPRFAQRLLRWFCAPHRLDELEGDLDELFQDRIKSVGVHRARWRYWRDVLSLMRPFVIRRQHTDYPSPTHTTMIRNYLTVAFRNLARAKSYAFINIAGLSVGMAASALIALWIQSELTYDQFYSKTDRLFQVYNRDTFNGTTQAWETTPRPLAPALKQDYPDIDDASRYRPITFVLTANDKNVNIDGAFADPTFLNLFDFPFLTGNAQASLSEPNGIVITKSLAESLFGTTQALGKIIQVDHKDSFSVTGVLDDLPDNSRFSSISYLLPYNYFISLGWGSDDWSSNNEYTFVLLKDKVDPAMAENKIKRVTAQHLKGVLDDVSHRHIFLHPASKWHLYSKQDNGQLVDGKIVTVRLFGIIAAFILLIAAVNFINLSTARSEKRAKEVGIRKVAGAQKRSLVFQFISESVLLAFFAGLLALLLIVLCIPLFNTITGKQLSLAFGSVSFWLAAPGFVLFTGLLAGSYPAFYLASFQPIRVMKGTYQPVAAVFSPRKGLVVAQFTFTIVLIIATLVIRQQIHHAQNRESGYDQNNLLFAYLHGDLPSHYEALQQDLLRSGAAVSVGRSLGPLTDINSRQWGVSWPGSTKADKDIEFDRFGTDTDFLTTMGTKLTAGRALDVRQFPTDSNAVMLNETAVKTMHLKNPVGTSIRFLKQDWQVVGVLKDFVFASPYDPINPVIVSGPGQSVSLGWTSMRLNPANATAKNLEVIEAVFKKYNPGYPFEYTFADESYKAKFADEQRVGVLTSLFSGLSIFIACLGLFGLAAYTAQQRTKEIGIRKTLGASVASIVQLLTKEFIYLTLAAFLIGAPIGWYAMHRWLEDYTYRITIGIDVFTVTLLSAILIVLLTVSFQAIKAALVNPVKSLRSE